MINTSLIILLVVAVTSADLEGGNELKTKADGGVCTGPFSCVDCWSSKVCVSTPDGAGYTQYKQVVCNETSVSTSTSTPTPYCNPKSGTCTATPPVSCGPPGNFTCVRDGTFPDPNDCNRYYVCQKSVAYAYKCERFGQYYDSSRESCTSGITCYTFNCRGKHGVKIPYGKTANIFGFCVNGTTIVVDKCSGNYELNADSQECEPVCYAEGPIADVSSCTKYYNCVKSSQYSTTYTITSESCYQGYGFDPIYKRCVLISLLKDCQP